MAIRRFSGSGITAGGKSSKVWDQETTPGTFESISSTVVPSAGASSVTFSNIPQNYSHLQLRVLALNASHSGDVYMQFNGDTNTNYARHYLYGTGSGISAGNATSVAYIYAAFEHSTGGVGIADIIDYTNTTKYKTVKSVLGDYRIGSNGEFALTSGLWLNTSAISSITVVPGSGSFTQYSHFALYGIRGA